METNKKVIDYCGNCLFQSEYQDMNASCYCCTLPKGLSEAIKMCQFFAGNCPYFLSKQLIDDVKKDTIARFRSDNIDFTFFVVDKKTR